MRGARRLGGPARRVASAWALGILLAGAGPAAGAGQLDTLDEVGAAIRTCWNPAIGAPGDYVTVSFSFRRDGTLSGPPQPAAIHVAGDAPARRRYVDAAISALQRCAPFHLAPFLADRIAGLTFTMPFPAAPGQ